MGPRSTVLMASDSANPSENNDVVYDQPTITNNVTSKSKLDKYNNAAPNPRTETMTITSGPLPGSPDW